MKRLAIVSFALIGLSACGAEDRELQAWIDEVKARPGGAIEPLPEISPAPSFVYEQAGRRSPFVPDAPQAGPSETGVGPDLDRPREYLEGEPLDALTMVGTLSDPEGSFGLVQDSQGLVHRVTIGNHMGQNYGRITDISESQIQLLEIIADGLGGYYERPASIGLSD
ncbi:MAG: pilus assembly protein PilP [Gammaproteobacteria bacterium]